MAARFIKMHFGPLFGFLFHGITEVHRQFYWRRVPSTPLTLDNAHKGDQIRVLVDQEHAFQPPVSSTSTEVLGDPTETDFTITPNHLGTETTPVAVSDATSRYLPLLALLFALLCLLMVSKGLWCYRKWSRHTIKGSLISIFDMSKKENVQEGHGPPASPNISPISQIVYPLPMDSIGSHLEHIDPNVWQDILLAGNGDKDQAASNGGADSVPDLSEKVKEQTQQTPQGTQPEPATSDLPVPATSVPPKKAEMATQQHLKIPLPTPALPDLPDNAEKAAQQTSQKPMPAPLIPELPIRIKDDAPQSPHDPIPAPTIPSFPEQAEEVNPAAPIQAIKTRGRKSRRTHKARPQDIAPLPNSAPNTISAPVRPVDYSDSEDEVSEVPQIADTHPSFLKVKKGASKGLNTDKLEACLRRITELEAEKKTESESAARHVSELTGQNDELRKDTEADKERIAKLMNIVAGLEKQHIDDEETIKSTSDSVTRLEAETLLKDQAISELTEQHVTDEKTIKASSERVPELEAETLLKDQAISKLTAQHATDEKTIKASSERVTELEAETLLKDQAISKLTAQHVTDEETITSLSDQVTELEAHLVLKDQAIATLDTQHTTEKNALAKDNRVLHTRISSLEAEITQKSTVIESLENRNAGLERDKDSATSDSNISSVQPIPKPSPSGDPGAPKAFPPGTGGTDAATGHDPNSSSATVPSGLPLFTQHGIGASKSDPSDPTISNRSPPIAEAATQKPITNETPKTDEVPFAVDPSALKVDPLNNPLPLKVAPPPLRVDAGASNGMGKTVAVPAKDGGAGDQNMTDAGAPPANGRSSEDQEMEDVAGDPPAEIPTRDSDAMEVDEETATNGDKNGQAGGQYSSGNSNNQPTTSGDQHGQGSSGDHEMPDLRVNPQLAAILARISQPVTQSSNADVHLPPQPSQAPSSSFKLDSGFKFDMDVPFQSSKPGPTPFGYQSMPPAPSSGFTFGMPNTQSASTGPVSSGFSFEIPNTQQQRKIRNPYSQRNSSNGGKGINSGPPLRPSEPPQRESIIRPVKGSLSDFGANPPPIPSKPAPQCDPSKEGETFEQFAKSQVMKPKHRGMSLGKDIEYAAFGVDMGEAGYKYEQYVEMFDLAVQNARSRGSTKIKNRDMEDANEDTKEKYKMYGDDDDDKDEDEPYGKGGATARFITKEPTEPKDVEEPAKDPIVASQAPSNGPMTTTNPHKPYPIAKIQKTARLSEKMVKRKIATTLSDSEWEQLAEVFLTYNLHINDLMEAAKDAETIAREHDSWAMVDFENLVVAVEKYRSDLLKDTELKQTHDKPLGAEECISLLQTYRLEYNRDPAIEWSEFSRGYVTNFNDVDIKNVVSMARTIASTRKNPKSIGFQEQMRDCDLRKAAERWRYQRVMKRDGPQ